MNFIAIIILGTIGVDFIVNLVADGLNLKHLKKELPQAFRGVYDADRYRKSQQYLKVNTQYGWVTSTFNLSVILVFWFAKGFPLLDQWVRSFEWGPVLTGLIYMGILMLFKAVLSLPFSLYATFVIEERFGFNTTTWKTYFMDLIKGLVLALLLGTPLLAAILAFFQYAGSNAWWYCWIGMTLYMLGVQFIAPNFVLCEFDQFSSGECLSDGWIATIHKIKRLFYRLWQTQKNCLV
jgi:STE24 endopeptidase